MMPFGTLFYGFLYEVLPAEWILIVSGVTLIICVLFLLRSSIIEMAHPELKKEKTIEVIEAKA